jgi:hypothetical protein
MWDLIILIAILVVIAISFFGLIYILVKKPKDEVTIKTRTLLIAIITISLFLIRSYWTRM